MKTTIVIPTYNEAENLSALAEAVFDLQIPDMHILVVDDNSSDGTGDIAEELGVKYDGRVKVLHRPGKLGLGTAYIQGFKLALEQGADAVGQMDADFSHPPEKWVEMVEALNDCDIAVGSRYIPGGSVDQEWPIWRKFLSAFGNIYARTILRIPLNDVTGGFKLFRKDALLAMPLERIRSNGYIFQVEMAYVASLIGLRFKEVPFYFADRKLGESKMSFKIQLEAAVRTWALLLAYRDLKNKAVVK